MIQLPLSHKERKAYREGLTRSHRIRLLVDVLDRNEEHAHPLAAPIISGQVDYGSTRTLTLNVGGEVKFEPESPSEAHAFVHRFLRVRYSLEVAGLQRWVEVPVFWGPITGYVDEGRTATITAQGKDILYRAPRMLWEAKQRSWRKGHQIIDVIEDILRDMGEERIDFPVIDRPLNRPVSISNHQEPWLVLRKLARTLNRQLFFDGRGMARLRRWPDNPVWTFDEELTSRPQITYDLSEMRNTVEVLGPPSHGKYERVRAVAMPNPRHPLSPRSLSRNGEPQHLVEALGVEVPERPGGGERFKHHERWREVLANRRRHAQEVADHTLKRRLRAQITTAFESLPVPHVEEGDTYAVIHEGKVIEFEFKEGTLPLRAGETMSIGFTKRVSHRDRRRRRRRIPRVPR